MSTHCIETILEAQPTGQLIIEAKEGWWMAIIRDEMGEIVDASARDFTSLFEHLEDECAEWLEVHRGSL